jgi:hypothetical protein
MRHEQLMEEMLDDLDGLATRATRLACPSLQRLLAMAYLELRLFSVQSAMASDGAGLLARIRNEGHKG